MSKKPKLGIQFNHPVEDLKGLNLLTGPVGDDFIISLETLYQPQVHNLILANISLPGALISIILEYALLCSEFVDSIFSSGILNDIKMLINDYPQLVNYRNAAGRTPLDIAFNKEKVDSKTIKYLIMNEAKLSNFQGYYFRIRDSLDPSLTEGLEYYINAPSLLTLAFLEKIFGAASDIISAYLYGDEGKADAGITLSTELISVIDGILGSSNYVLNFLENRKADFERAKNLIDQGAHTLIQKLDDYGSYGKSYHAIFSQFFYGGIPAYYGLSDSELGLYEKLYQSSPNYYTRFFLTLLIYDWKYLRPGYPKGAIVSKLFNVYINAKADIDKVFFFAIKYHHLEIINNLKKSRLLKEFKINQKDCNQQTALYLATACETPVEILRTLLEMDADVNYRYEIEPIEYFNKDRDHKKIEVSKKIEGYRMLMTTPKTTFHLGDSAIHTAIRQYLQYVLYVGGESRLLTISTLLELKADVNLKNGSDGTPLHLVMGALIDRDTFVADKCSTVIATLLDAKADMNIPSQGKSPLCLAMQLGHKPLIHLFYKYENELLFKKFLELFSPGIFSTFFNRDLVRQLNSIRESKITTMRGVMDFFCRNVKEGETYSHAVRALQQLEQHILKEGGVKLGT